MFWGFVAALLLIGAAAATWLPRAVFAWGIAVPYLVGAVTALTLMIAFQIRMRTAVSADALNLRLIERLGNLRYGPFFLPLQMLSLVLAVLVWPVQGLGGAYLQSVARRMRSPMAAGTVGQPLIPAWLQPAVGILTVMLLIGLGAADVRSYPLKLVALALAAATFLVLILSAATGGIKAAVLGRRGNAKLNLAVVIVSTLGCTAMTRSYIDRWSGGAAAPLLESAGAILSLDDIHAFLTHNGWSARTLVESPGVVTNILSTPPVLGLKAFLNSLFYIGFARAFLGLFTAKRQPEDHLALGTAYAVIGHYDKAESHLSQARDLSAAQLMRCGVFLLDGRFAQLASAAKKACALLDHVYSREEEATVSVVGIITTLPIDVPSIVAYIRYKPDEFADTALPLVLLLIPHVVNPAEGDEQRILEASGNAFWIETFFLDRRSKTAEVRQRLRTAPRATVCDHLFCILIGVSSFTDPEVDGYPDREVLDRVEADLAGLLAVSGNFQYHWQALMTCMLLNDSRTLLSALVDGELPALEAVIKQAQARVAELQSSASEFEAGLAAGQDQQRRAVRNLRQMLAGGSGALPIR